jgi:hypothetical protein
VNRKISLGLFVAAIVLFLLPWANLSCSGTPVATFTGLDIVTGKNYDAPSSFGATSSDRADSEPLAVGALAAAVAGAIAALVWKKAGIARVVLGVAGVVLLAALKIKLDGDISKQGQGMVQISYQVGYWLTIVAFAGAAAASLFKREIALKLGTVPEESKPGTGREGGEPPPEG